MNDKRKKHPANPSRRPELPGAARRGGGPGCKPQPDYARRGGRQRTVH